MTMPDLHLPLGQPRFARLTPQQCEQLHHANLTILERTGVRLFELAAIDLLQQAGAAVDGVTVCDALPNIDFLMSLCLLSDEAALTIAVEAMSGGHLIHDLGYLESGLTFSLAQRAADKVEATLAAHRTVPLSDDAAKAVHAIVERAARQAV